MMFKGHSASVWQRDVGNWLSACGPGSKLSKSDIAVRGNHFPATGNRMPYVITQCYLPPGSGDFPTFFPAKAGTQVSEPRGMQRWVDVEDAVEPTDNNIDYNNCCRYTWTCSVFLSRNRSCFTAESLDSVLLPRSVETASVVRPVMFKGRQLRSDAKDFLFTLTIWKTNRTRSSTSQLLTTASHSAGDHSISEAQLE